jgi:dephospho-CoA kinase
VLRVGLTGGAGSGKSTVTAELAALGVPVIDADRVAREVVEPGQPALGEIVAAFGNTVVGPDGRLDRRALRRQVFADDAARRRLEAILHPRIYAAMQAQVQRLDAPYCVLAVPLLVESGGLDHVDRVLVVDAPPALQVRRLCARDGIDETGARRMLQAQATREVRLAAAQDVIRNDADLAALHRQVLELHRSYLRLAQANCQPHGSRGE